MKGRPELSAHKRESRIQQGAQLRGLYRSLGHDRTSVAKFLHVTGRTLYNWETGRAAIPFAALKLLRVMARSELPGKDWQGWTFNRGTLWSPEGHGFKAHDFSWLSITIRQARMFTSLYRERSILHRALKAAAAEVAQARATAEAAEAHVGLVDLAMFGGLPGPDQIERDGHGSGAAAHEAGALGRGCLVTRPERTASGTGQPGGRSPVTPPEMFMGEQGRRVEVAL